MTNYNDTQIIIMAGGVGSRFWPMSTPDYPKQFIDVMGVGRSLIQLTVDRLKPICPVENMWVVTNEKYISIVKEQIPDMPVDNRLSRKSQTWRQPSNTLPLAITIGMPASSYGTLIPSARQSEPSSQTLPASWTRWLLLSIPNERKR